MTEPGSDHRQRVDGLIVDGLADLAYAATLVTEAIRWGEDWPAFDDDENRPLREDEGPSPAGTASCEIRRSVRDHPSFTSRAQEGE